MENINPDQVYSLMEAVALIPQIKSRTTLAGYISRKELKAQAYGRGVKKRYLIKGDAIIEFLKTYDPAATRKKLRIERLQSKIKKQHKN